MNDPRDDRIAAAWAVQRVALVPAEAPAEQVRDVRRAFYAGARALYNIVGQDMAPAEAERIVRALNDELMRFAHDVQEGRR